MTDLERSHSELRAAIIIAGRHIRRLRPGVVHDPVLKHLRQVLKESRMLAKGQKRIGKQFAFA